MASFFDLRPRRRAAGDTVALPAGQPPGSRSRRAVSVFGALALAFASLAPAAAATDPLTVRTAYPAIVVAPGSHVSFNVDVKTATPQRVGLVLAGVPAGWTATIHGGGYIVDAVQTDGTAVSTVRIDVTVPADATGTASMTLTATAGSEVQTQALEVRVEASAGGDLTLKTDFPSLRGPASQTFNFNLTLDNQTAEDLTFSVNAQGPEGWDVQAKLAGQTGAASAIIKAGSTSAVTVSAVPPDGVAAGKYQLQVVATAGSRNITGALEVEVTGSYKLALSTADGRLNGHGAAGSATSLSLSITNSGTAAVTNVKFAGTPPSGWTVTFDPESIDSLGANETKTVTAKLVPSADAVAGDYVVTLRATGDQSTSSSTDIRFTVETSLQWAIVGLALIVAVVAGLWWVFQRYGRR